MSDIGDCFAGMKEASQERRAANRENSAERLKEAGIFYGTHNDGAHLTIIQGRYRFDFWPGTGKYWVRFVGRDHPRKEKRGVFNLIKDVGKIKQWEVK